MKSSLPVLVCLALLTSSCCKKPDSDSAPPAPPVATTAVPATTATAPSIPSATFDVPFKGNYRRHAGITIKNGRRVPSATAKGSAILLVESGKVTYTVTYPSGGKDITVTQVYTFTEADMKAVRHGAYDVTLTWQSIDTDKSIYSPDKNKPSLEVVSSSKGWEIGFRTTDNNGVTIGAEFDPS